MEELDTEIERRPFDDVFTRCSHLPLADVVQAHCFSKAGRWMAISLAGRVTIAIVYLMEARALYGLGRERWLGIILAIALNYLLT